MAKAKKSGGKRKSKAESMTGKKASEVETRTGSLDLKPIELSNDDVEMHIKAIKAATEKKDTAVSLLRSCNKNADKLHAGLAAAIKRAITAERANDAAALKTELELLNITLKATNSPIQLTVHDMLLGDVKEAAYKRGYKAGETAQTLSDPYPAASELSREYVRGWHHGTGKNLGQTPEQVDAALAGDGEQWPDDAQTKAAAPVNGATDDSDGIPAALDRRTRQPELTH